jgi:ATP-dependent helicase/nuclease subunit B
MQTLYRFSSLNKKGASTLIDAVVTTDEKREELKNIVDSTQIYNRKLSSEKAKKLYGNNIPMSATRFDTFFGCHFRFFCKYGLNTSIIQPAKLDVMQRGTIVHYVLEQFCNNHLDDMGCVSREQIVDETTKYITEYFASIKGSETLFDERFTFLVEKIEEAIIEVIERIVEEFSQSKFKVEKCEVSIGNDGTIPTVTFPFGSDGKLSLYGSIDRLDRWGSFIRIVDYKTGSKTFKLSDTLYGLNMQMLLYLYCVIRGENPDYKGKNPAGILYLPSKRDLNKSGLSMNGIICANSDVVTAMESENEGKYIPKYKINKDGTPSKSNTSFIPEEAFDTIFDHIENLAKKLGEDLHSGEISVAPVESGEYSACKYCDYKSVCLKDEKDDPKKVESLKNDEVFAKMRGEDENEV